MQHPFHSSPTRIPVLSPHNSIASSTNPSRLVRSGSVCHAFAHQLKFTITDKYLETTIPSGLDAPWFLRDHDNDESTASLNDSTANEVDPEDHNYFAPMDHLYNEPPAVPSNPGSLHDKPFTAPSDSQESEGGMVRDQENEGGATKS
jgi:hypothetical protein